MALETLAHEQGMACRRVKLKVNCRSRLDRPDHAVIPGLVLFQGDRPVLCDLHGNQTPRQVIDAFTEHYGLQLQPSCDMENLDAWNAWTDAGSVGRRIRKLAGQGQYQELVNAGRAILQEFHLQQNCIAGIGKAAGPIRRI